MFYLYYWFRVGEATFALHHLISNFILARPDILQTLPPLSYQPFDKKITFTKFFPGRTDAHSSGPRVPPSPLSPHSPQDAAGEQQGRGTRPRVPGSKAVSASMAAGPLAGRGGVDQPSRANAGGDTIHMRAR
jgi:hypothetical protein